MVQIVKISDEKRVPLPVPEWLSKPVSGEEARQRAKKIRGPYAEGCCRQGDRRKRSAPLNLSLIRFQIPVCRGRAAVFLPRAGHTSGWW